MITKRSGDSLGTNYYRTSDRARLYLSIQDVSTTYYIQISQLLGMPYAVEIWPVAQELYVSGFSACLLPNVSERACPSDSMPVR